MRPSLDTVAGRMPIGPTGRIGPGPGGPYDGALVCLLVALFHVDPHAPVVIAANRDEYLSRPAVAMAALDPEGSGRRVLGGRDLVGGGTWLAVNDAGVVAGLTNRPLPDGPDRAKRSRGELPLRLVRHATAAAAVAAFVDDIKADDYNPAWLLVADRTSLYFVDVTSDPGVAVEELPPGIHVLENRDLHEPSAKGDRVRALLRAEPATTGRREVAGLDGLTALLGDHHRPCADGPEPPETSRLAVEARTICVHADADDYGTRSSSIIRIGNDPSSEPEVTYTDGAPCQARWHSARDLW
jgi:uncharacterized protein with NRDE domain